MEYRVPCDNCNKTGKEKDQVCIMCFGEGYHLVSLAEHNEYWKNTKK